MNSDKDPRNKVGAGRPSSTFARMERMPPMQMLLYLSIVASSVLFVVLSIAYAQTRFQSAMPQGLHPFPRYFSISTIVLLVSSYTIAQARRLYQQDDVPMLSRCLGATLLLAAIFVGMQGLGWRELIAQGVFFNGEASGTYVYLLSALHILHLLGGVLFLMILFLRTAHAARDGVRTLVFIRNPYRRRQLQMLALYWHFLDALWLGLFAVFLFLY